MSRLPLSVPPEDRGSTTDWWQEGNTLALVEAMQKHVRNPLEGEFLPRLLNSHLIGAARVIGMSEGDIRAAFQSDRNLTIYEP